MRRRNGQAITGQAQYFAALINAPLWALPVSPITPNRQAQPLNPTALGLGAAADDLYTTTAVNARAICDNPEWYDWINPGIWAMCLPGDIANVYQAVTGDYGRPTMTTPAARPPAAPQTRPALVTWTPDDIDEAQAQRQRQYAEDMAAIRQGNGNIPIDPTPPPPAENDNTLFYVLGAVAVTGVGIAIFSGRSR